MALPQANYYTEEEYLAFDLADDRPNELNADGTVTRREGRSWTHVTIAGNLLVSLGNQLDDSDCIILQSLMRLKIQATGTYRYPDTSVVCGTPELADTEPESLLNPIVLIEILSDFTELVDRRDKLQEYRQIPSLKEYLLISQDTAQVERYLRQDDINWIYTALEGLDQKIELPSIGCTLQFSDIYQRIRFEDEE